MQCLEESFPCSRGGKPSSETQQTESVCVTLEEAISSEHMHLWVLCTLDKRRSPKLFLYSFLSLSHSSLSLRTKGQALSPPNAMAFFWVAELMS